MAAPPTSFEVVEPDVTPPGQASRKRHVNCYVVVAIHLFAIAGVCFGVFTRYCQRYPPTSGHAVPEIAANVNLVGSGDGADGSDVHLVGADGGGRCGNGGSTGYGWCPSSESCIREWETSCPGGTLFCQQACRDFCQLATYTTTCKCTENGQALDSAPPTYYSPRGEAFPKEWGPPPSSDKGEVELPGFYGHGSGILSLWIRAHMDNDRLIHRSPNGVPYPASWGAPPAQQVKDLRKLPGCYGSGSSTLVNWIDAHLAEDGIRMDDETDKRRPFPPHWGEPPSDSASLALVELPCGFGWGSAELIPWIEDNLARDGNDVKDVICFDWQSYNSGRNFEVSEKLEKVIVT